EGPTSVCVGEAVTYTAVNAGDAFLSWAFTGNFTQVASTDNSVTVQWNTFGTRSVSLTVDNDGCISTNTVNVSVTNSPSQCGGNLTANGSVNNLQARDVMIEWQISADGSAYSFELERSVDGVNFSPIATVSAPVFVSANDLATYRQGDISPLAGRTFYRVRLVDAEYGDVLSNVVEMQLGEPSTMLGRIFPNPANGGMIHVETTDVSLVESPASVQLYDVRGNPVGPRRYLNIGTGVINLNAQSQAAGVYFLRISVGDRTETHRVIMD
ncbi:MAG: T9SS type A sorting domain-containing protein, partial [Bacteroidota bacterium]